MQKKSKNDNDRKEVAAKGGNAQPPDTHVFESNEYTFPLHTYADMTGSQVVNYDANLATPYFGLKKDGGSVFAALNPDSSILQLMEEREKQQREAMLGMISPSNIFIKEPDMLGGIHVDNGHGMAGIVSANSPMTLYGKNSVLGDHLIQTADNEFTVKAPEYLTSPNVPWATEVEKQDIDEEKVKEIAQKVIEEKSQADKGRDTERENAKTLEEQLMRRFAQERESMTRGLAKIENLLSGGEKIIWRCGRCSSPVAEFETVADMQKMKDLLDSFLKGGWKRCQKSSAHRNVFRITENDTIVTCGVLHEDFVDSRKPKA